MILFIGNINSFFFNLIKRLEDPEHILWVDFSFERTQQLWNTWWEKHHSSVIKLAGIRAIIPHKTNDGVDWSFIYQSLCVLYKLSARLDIVFAYYTLTENTSLDSAQLNSFVNSDLLKNASNHKIFKYSANLFYNSRKQRLIKYAKNISQQYLSVIREQEKLNKINIPSDLKLWHSNFIQTFREKISEKEKIFKKQLNNFNLRPSAQQMINSFGDSRHSQFSLRLSTLLDQFRDKSTKDYRDQKSDSTIIRIFNPFLELTYELLEFKAHLPKFCNTLKEFEIDKICPVYQDPESLSDGSLAEELFAIQGGIQGIVNPATTFMRPVNQHIKTAAESINQLLPRQPQRAGQPQTPRLSRQERNRHMQIIRRELDVLALLLKNITDNEIAIFNGNIGLILEKPGIFKIAYEQLLKRLFKEHFIDMVAKIWRTRRFIFSIPVSFPAPFFRQSGLIVQMLNALSEGFRLLNLYLTLTIFQEEIYRIHYQLGEIRSLSKKLKKHYDNIIEELNYILFYIERVQADDLISKEICFVKNLPQKIEKTDLYDSFEKNLKPLLGEIEKSFTENRCNQEDRWNCWIPACYNHKEAWFAAEQMVNIVSENDFLQKVIMDSDLPAGGCAIESIEEPFKKNYSTEWTDWKKKGLAITREPFSEDICRHVKINYFDLSGFIDNLFSKGFEHNFINRTKSGITITMKAWPFFDLESRSFFFQRNTPLLQNEFISKMAFNSFNSIYNWLNWVLKLEHFKENFRKTLIKNVLDFIPAQNVSKKKSEKLFDAVSKVLNENQVLFHPYYGEPCYSEDSGFLLLECLDTALMVFFNPDRFSDAKSRCFHENYLKSQLKQDHVLLESLTRAFEDYCIFHNIDTRHLFKL
ncbi:MAG: hypothetical protein U9P10_13805 [Thermodesulfobacteriota bacterium]|nr:hypothetical protein [Thermodesulfobacteriota bacterium]